MSVPNTKIDHPELIRQESGRIRLGTLVGIRWIAVTGQIASLLIVRWIFDFRFDLLTTSLPVLASAGLNLYLQGRYSSSRQLTDPQAFGQFAYDLLQLGVLLFLTGGLKNPFSVLMLVPVTISANILSRRSTYGLLATAVLISSILAVWHRDLPWSGEPPSLPILYLAGLWIALTVSMIFLALYAARVSAEARRRTRALSATQAALAREHKMSALGALAAAAAHELGSPLGTIALAARELSRDLDADDSRRADAELIASQAARCRDILQRLSRYGDDADGEAFLRQPAAALLEEAARPFRQIGPAIEIRAAPVDGSSASQPVVGRRPEVIHGLTNLIDNAVDFAHRRVDIELGWSAESVAIEISDDGAGFDAAILKNLGEPYVTTRGHKDAPGTQLLAGDYGGGLGLGIFIAKTLLEKTGATLSFVNREQGGAAVSIRWARDDFETVATPQTPT